MIKNYISNPYKFHVFATALMYLPGICISLFFLDYEYRIYALSLLLIFISGFLFSYLGWAYARKRTFLKRGIIREVDLRLIYIFLFIYIATTLYTFTNTPPALFSFGDASLVAELRAASTKGKLGIDSIINALQFASSYVCLPSLVLTAFWNNWKMRYSILLASILSLMLSLQKARAFIVFLPLLIMYSSRGKLWRTIAILSAFILLITLSINLVGLDSNFFYHRVYKTSLLFRATTGDRMLFQYSSPINFMINRIVWIPTITALDWLRYHAEVLNGDLLFGSSIPILYMLFGHSSRFRLENEIFKFQFNASSESLGSANSHYLLDAYLNFGAIGVVVYSFIFGMLLGLTFEKISKPTSFCIYNYSYNAVIANLHSLLIGGGWLIFVFLSFKKKIIFSTSSNYRR
jgi:hypothetical protein